MTPAVVLRRAAWMSAVLLAACSPPEGDVPALRAWMAQQQRELPPVVLPALPAASAAFATSSASAAASGSFDKAQVAPALTKGRDPFHAPARPER